MFAKYVRYPSLDVNTSSDIENFHRNKQVFRVSPYLVTFLKEIKCVYFSKSIGSSCGCRNVIRSKDRKLIFSAYSFFKYTSEEETRKLDFSVCQDITAEACMG
jgi:hypothetical protein